MNMKKWLALAVACSTLTLGACGGKTETAAGGASAPAAASGKVYRVAMNAEFAPFESMNEKNEAQGFDVDLMNAMAEVGHFKVEYKHQPWESLFAALKNGDVDMLASAVTIKKGMAANCSLERTLRSSSMPVIWGMFQSETIKSIFSRFRTSHAEVPSSASTTF